MNGYIIIPLYVGMIVSALLLIKADRIIKDIEKNSEEKTVIESDEETIQEKIKFEAQKLADEIDYMLDIAPYPCDIRALLIKRIENIIWRVQGEAQREAIKELQKRVDLEFARREK